MRYRVAVLMLLFLLAVLSVWNVLAAQAPDPLGILDIGSPPKGKTREQYLKEQIAFKTDLDTLNTVLSYPEVRKLPSICSLKDARPWLAKNLRVAPEKGDRLLRFTFRAGKRNEQVAIINAILRVSIFRQDMYGTHLKGREEWLHYSENRILELEQRIDSGQHRQMVDTYRLRINKLRYTDIPELHAEIDRLKQYAVTKWAR